MAQLPLTATKLQQTRQLSKLFNVFLRTLYQCIAVAGTELAFPWPLRETHKGNQMHNLKLHETNQIEKQSHHGLFLPSKKMADDEYFFNYNKEKSELLYYLCIDYARFKPKLLP